MRLLIGIVSLGRFLPLVLICLCGCSRTFRPNIVLIVAEDAYWGGLSCQMHPGLDNSCDKQAQTPHLAELASKGCRFSAAYASSPIAAVSEQSLITGKSAARLSLQPNLGDSATITERLESVGYRVVDFETVSKRQPFFMQISVPSMAVEKLDQQVGKIVAKIDSLGLSETTYMIFTASSGAADSGQPSLLAGGGADELLEASIRVPLIVRGPGVAANSWSQQRVVGFDWYPTLCHLASVPNGLPENLDGGSILHLLAGDTSVVERPHEALVFYLPEPQKTAIMIGDHKLIHHSATSTIQVFDLHRDIGEQKDVSSESSDFSQRMLLRMHDLLKFN